MIQEHADGSACARVYTVILNNGGLSRRLKRLLRPDEVHGCLSMFNRFSELTGITAEAHPVNVELPSLDSYADAQQ